MKAWYPTIQHYAYFANGNWETAALQTNMAIAVFKTIETYSKALLSMPSMEQVTEAFPT